MDALSRMGGKTARDLLREVAAGKIEIRTLEAADLREAADRAADWQQGFPPEEETPDRDYAARRLAALRR